MLKNGIILCVPDVIVETRREFPQNARLGNAFYIIMITIAASWADVNAARITEYSIYYINATSAIQTCASSKKSNFNDLEAAIKAAKSRKIEPRGKRQMSKVQNGRELQRNAFFEIPISNYKLRLVSLVVHTVHRASRQRELAVIAIEFVYRNSLVINQYCSVHSFSISRSSCRL